MLNKSDRQRSQQKRRDRHKRGFLRRQGKGAPLGTCHWCKLPIVWLSLIPKSNRVSIDNQKMRAIVWIGKKRWDILIGTSDHLIEVGKGGAFTDANAVPSCFPCNNNRSNETTAIA